MAIDLATSLGRAFLNILPELGAVFIFFLRALVTIFRYPFQVDRIVQQVFFVGAKSVFSSLSSGCSPGMVLSLQMYYGLARFGSEGVLGGIVTLSLIQEIGPVLTAIMIVARPARQCPTRSGS